MYESMAIMEYHLAIYIGIALAFYIYFSAAFTTIAQKLGHKYVWLVWIPIVNYFYVFSILNLGVLLGFLSLLVIFYVALINYIAAYIAVMVMWFILFSEMCYLFKKPPQWSLTVFVPFVNLIVLGLFAWKWDVKKVEKQNH